MTTIIYSTKEKLMLADSLVVAGNTIVGEDNCKIIDMDKHKVGFAGCLRDKDRFINFLNGGEEFEGEFSAIVVDKNTYTVATYSENCWPETYEADYYCIGSGSDFALAALTAGVDAMNSMITAILLDPYSGGTINRAYL